MDSSDDLAATLVEWAARDADIGRAAAAEAAAPRLEYLADRCDHLEAELQVRERTIAELREQLAVARQSPSHRLASRLRALRASR